MDDLKVGRLGPFPKVNKPVFIISVILVTVFIAFGTIYGESAKLFFSDIQNVITNSYGWLFIILMNAAVFMSLYLILSKYGDIRLGHQTERPQYSLISWIGMLFSAGIGIGLMYWGTAEPLYHYMAPPMGDAETVEAAKQAMNISFLHYGIHAWAVYGIVALSLAYFHYRRGLPLSIRSTLFPILGKRIYGGWGHTVDILAIFGTLFGVVTTLGLGVLQINSGLDSLFGVANTVNTQIMLIAGITILACGSLMLGLDKGIKRLSDVNILLTFLLLTFAFVMGPTQFIIDSFVENIGNYIHDLVPLSFWSEAYSDTNNWQSYWTVFYWAWWVSWSPFVGVFIARISRGRTIKEFLLGVLFIPMTILFFWFTTFGGSAVKMELDATLTGAVSPGLVDAVKVDPGSAIFRLMDLYPLAEPITLLIVVMIILWFVTSSDSASFVVDMLIAGGDINPPKIQRLFWAITEGLIAAVLLYVGGEDGLNALRAAAIAAGFPFAIVILVMMYALIRALGRDKLILYRNQQRYITDESVEHNSANEFVDEHLLKGPPKFIKDE